jgi:NADPH-dependent curcumin reductase CurA
MDVSSLTDGEVVIRIETLSIDAFLRTMLDEGAFHGVKRTGDTMTAFGIGVVIAAGPSAKFKIGQRVVGPLGAQEFSRLTPHPMIMPLLSLPFVPNRLWLSLLGLTTGITAWVGMFRVLPRPRKGETVVVSAATGATGSIAAQLAKSTGARVIGVAGGPAKSKFLTDTLCLDGAVDYKSKEHSLDEQLKALAPKGVDFFFDCAGGDILDTVLRQIRPKGRVVICGAASQYSGNLHGRGVQGPSEYLKLAEIGATMKGYVVTQYLPFLAKPWAMLCMIFKWARGHVVNHEQLEKGIYQFAIAMEKMFTGGHMGKLLVDVSE